MKNKGSNKISKVKQSTTKQAKLKKQGKFKGSQHKSKSKKKFTKPTQPPRPDAEEESIQGDEIIQMMDDDDLNFMNDSANNQNNSLKKNTGCKSDKKNRKRKRDMDEDDDDDDEIERQYEEEMDVMQPKRKKHLLPIKTKDGLVHRSVDIESDAETDKEEEVEEPEQPAEEEEEVDSDVELEQKLFGGGLGLELSGLCSTAELLAARHDAVDRYKVLIGVLASGLLETPHEKKNNFKKLLSLMNPKIPEVQHTASKLATLSLLEVYKDLIPSYRIGHHDSDEVKLKKETRELRGFEQTLLATYKSYLQGLEKFVAAIKKSKIRSKQATKQEIRLAELALNCMCELLTTHPYFNFSQNLAQMLVPYLNHPLPSVREMCAKCMRRLFKTDKRGEISLLVVRQINALVKSQAHEVHQEVLTVLLSLRIKEVNLEKEKEEEKKQHTLKKHKQRIFFLSRNERKRKKKLQDVENELLETKAEENRKAKHKYLTEITKFVFTIYFRVLKKAPSSKILSICLEGLAQFAHCINVEFYHDIVTVLNDLLEHESLGHREQLHCVQTVFTILSGHGEGINIDPLHFYTHTYRNLFVIHAGRSNADLPILLRTMNMAFVQRRKKVSQQRVLSFTKRLATLALQLLHNGTLGCLAMVRTIFQLFRSVDILLDPDATVGQGVYFPEIEDPEYCNANNTALWELAALERHYHPTVRTFARNIVLGVPATGEGVLHSEHTKLNPEEIFAKFDPSEMIFRPVVPARYKTKRKLKFPSHILLKNNDLANLVKQVLDAPNDMSVDFSRGLFT